MNNNITSSVETSRNVVYKRDVDTLLFGFQGTKSVGPNRSEDVKHDVLELGLELLTCAGK